MCRKRKYKLWTKWKEKSEEKDERIFYMIKENYYINVGRVKVKRCHLCWNEESKLIVNEMKRKKWKREERNFEKSLRIKIKKI